MFLFMTEHFRISMELNYFTLCIIMVNFKDDKSMIVHLFLFSENGHDINTSYESFL